MARRLTYSNVELLSGVQGKAAKPLTQGVLNTMRLASIITAATARLYYVIGMPDTTPRRHVTQVLVIKEDR